MPGNSSIGSSKSKPRYTPPFQTPFSPLFITPQQITNKTPHRPCYYPLNTLKDTVKPLSTAKDDVRMPQPSFPARTRNTTQLTCNKKTIKNSSYAIRIDHFLHYFAKSKDKKKRGGHEATKWNIIASIMPIMKDLPFENEEEEKMNEHMSEKYFFFFRLSRQPGHCLGAFLSGACGVCKSLLGVRPSHLTTHLSRYSFHPWELYYNA